jgi:hypothetical protein
MAMAGMASIRGHFVRCSPLLPIQIITPWSPVCTRIGMDEAEPIRVTAHKHGQRTASMFWPGTQAEIRSVGPTYWRQLDPTVRPNDRVDQVLT